MTLSPIPPGTSCEKLKETVLNPNGTIKVLPAKEWLSFPWDEIRLFMHEYPIYVLPTEELIGELKELTAPFRKTIEIGAGSGNIGRNLGIIMTDSHLQERPDIKAYYESLGQPVIKYPSDVVRSEALAAVNILKPDCVVGCYVTHYSLEGDGSYWGVKFDRLLPKVKRLILVGNEKTHRHNPIIGLPHREITMENGLVTRAGYGPDNKIFVFDKQ